MRREGHPSRPRAITCCRFSSLKTLLIPTKATALRRNQRPRASFPLAGFEVTLIGRFWVTPEDRLVMLALMVQGEHFKIDALVQHWQQLADDFLATWPEPVELDRV